MIDVPLMHALLKAVPAAGGVRLLRSAQDA